MEFRMACGTWVKEEDEKVLDLLLESDRWLAAEELSEKTGLPLRRVEHTLKMLNRQMAMYEGRKKLFAEE